MVTGTSANPLERHGARLTGTAEGTLARNRDSTDQTIRLLNTRQTEGAPHLAFTQYEGNEGLAFLT